jgi:hypothetical protein
MPNEFKAGDNPGVGEESRAKRLAALGGPTQPSRAERG